ncbi:hypothetical protein NL676_025450 [Syzygium grande]|nr:hypothetical protein NL676_025450 [Syzygium grande]
MLSRPWKLDPGELLIRVIIEEWIEGAKVEITQKKGRLKGGVAGKKVLVEIIVALTPQSSGTFYNTTTAFSLSSL